MREWAKHSFNNMKKYSNRCHATVSYLIQLNTMSNTHTHSYGITVHCALCIEEEHEAILQTNQNI